MSEPRTAPEIANEMCAAIEEMRYPTRGSFADARERAGRAAAAWRELTSKLKAEANGA